MVTDSSLVKAWLTVQQRLKLVEADLVHAAKVIDDAMPPERRAYALLACMLSVSSLEQCLTQAMLIARQLEDERKEK